MKINPAGNKRSKTREPNLSSKIQSIDNSENMTSKAAVQPQENDAANVRSNSIVICTTQMPMEI